MDVASLEGRARSLTAWLFNPKIPLEKISLLRPPDGRCGLSALHRAQIQATISALCRQRDKEREMRALAEGVRDLPSIFYSGEACWPPSRKTSLPLKRPHIAALQALKAQLTQDPSLIGEKSGCGNLIHHTALAGNAEALKIVLAHDACFLPSRDTFVAPVDDIDIGGLTPLHCALYGGADLEVLRLLVNKAADINLQQAVDAHFDGGFKGMTPVMMAVAMGRKDFFDFVLQLNPREWPFDFTLRDAKGARLIDIAAAQEDRYFLERVTECMAQRAPGLDRIPRCVGPSRVVYRPERPPIVAPFEAENLGELAELIRNTPGINIDAQDPETGNTAYHNAFICLDFARITFLTRIGASPAIENKKAEIPAASFMSGEGDVFLAPRAKEALILILTGMLRR
jgi:ankyrin repeat protein